MLAQWKNLPGNAGDAGLSPGSRRASEEGNDSAPGFLPVKSHRQRSSEAYSPCGCKESDKTW